VDNSLTNKPQQHREKADIPKELNGMVWDPSSLCWKGNENDGALTDIDWGGY